MTDKEKTYAVVDGKRYTLDDMRDWFYQTRGFPSILFFGKGKNKIAGEGQSGGRFVTERVHQAENEFVAKLGVDEYKKKMDRLMKKPPKWYRHTLDEVM